MTPRALSALAVAGAAAALAVYSQTGRIPDAAGGLCVVSAAYGPCEAARALSADAGEEDCAPGSSVYRFVELVVDADGGTDSDAGLPPGFDGMPDTSRVVPCGLLQRPGKALTVSRANHDGCFIGPWEMDVPDDPEKGTYAGEPLRWDGKPETSKKCGVGVRCQPGRKCVTGQPALVKAGLDDTLRLFCLAVPDAGGCP